MDQLRTHSPRLTSCSPTVPAALAGPFMPVVHRPPVVMSRGRGSYLWDEKGHRYLDVVQGWATNALGHAPPELLAALTEQAGLLINASPAYDNRPAIELALLLTRITGTRQVALLNSGAEANETAIKLARKWGKKYKRGAFGVVTTHGAFHGRTLAAMAASGKPGWDELFPPYPPGFVRVPFGDLSAMERAIDPSCVALMVEPVQGEAGVVVPASGYLRGLRELADRHDLLLILDEVQTGVGRTGAFLAQQSESVEADVTTLGKGLGAGLPISAVLCNERAACFELGDNGSTHGGHALAANVALAVVRLVSESGFLNGVHHRAAELESRLRQLAGAWGRVTWRGRGLLQALVFEDPIAAELSSAAFERGLLVNSPRANVLRFMPQLRIESSELAELEAALEASRAALRGQ
jgi:acetylornithine/N-succinyldiaminopimelate aminotransferase